MPATSPAANNQQPLTGAAAMMLSSARRNLRTALEHPSITSEQRAKAEVNMMATQDTQQVMNMRKAVFAYIDKAEGSTQKAA